MKNKFIDMWAEIRFLAEEGMIMLRIAFSLIFMAGIIGVIFLGTINLIGR